MFDIEYKGGNTVVITTKKTTLVFDPKLSVNGLKDVKLDGAVELTTEDRFAIDNPGAKLQISSPGEYGVGDCDIKGIAATRNVDPEDIPKASIIYTVGVADSKIAILGNINEKLGDEQLEEIGVVDILIIPIGGNGLTMDSHGAAKLTKKIDPKVVIPIHFADSKLKYEVPQDGPDMFEKELGVSKESESKYKVKSSAVYPASLTLIELQLS